MRVSEGGRQLAGWIVRDGLIFTMERCAAMKRKNSAQWRGSRRCSEALAAGAALVMALSAPVCASVVQRMIDPGFESMTSGALAATGAVQGWEIQRTGRDAIKDRLVVTCVEEEAKAHSGKRCLSLAIPEDTVGFEYVTVGQRHKLAADKEYEASVWVRWTGGPERAPEGAGAASGQRSAIVSFWARHRDGSGDFAGRDVWLFDNRWRELSFRFRATDPGLPTFVYVSLLPNQKPADTTVLIDDFELHEMPATVETDSRAQIVKDWDFSGQQPGPIAPPWMFANIGGSGISGKVVVSGEQHYFTMAMGNAASNYESAQLWQYLDLRAGARYEVSCRMRWDNFSPDAPAPIVNYGIYHEESRAWYGPVDQTLKKSDDWETYRFIHVPPFSGTWKLYVQINGWGNFGHGARVSFDDFTCAPSRPVASVPPGAPKAADVMMWSLKIHPTNGKDPYDTLAAARAFHVTRLDWSDSPKPFSLTVDPRAFFGESDAFDEGHGNERKQGPPKRLVHRRG